MIELVKLAQLMDRTEGRPQVRIGLIDGPVLGDHPDLSSSRIRPVSPGAIGPGTRFTGTCSQANSFACGHGTFVAGILSGKRGSHSPAISPGCDLMVRPIFGESSGGAAALPASTPQEVAAAIRECVDAGARVLNLSAALTRPSPKGERELEGSLDYAARRGVITVAAAGNHGTVGGSVITRHPGVIPVVACDQRGVTSPESSLGISIGKRGLSAPGELIASLGNSGEPQVLSGTSAAAPFVTGTIALLWSLFPNAAAADIRRAVTQNSGHFRTTVVPPLLNGSAAFEMLAAGRSWRLN